MKKTPGLKPSTALALQAAIVLLGLAILALMLGEPHLEGRNAHATTFEVYFKDPFLAYVYVGSLPFFVALYQAFQLLGQVRRHGTFSPATLHSLRTIKYCALTLLAFIAGGGVFILLFGDGDDRPAGLFMTLLAASAAGTIAATATLFARTLQTTLSRPERLQA